MIKQRTIKKSVQARGVGIHSGKTVNMKLLPAELNHGIVFRRMDAGGKEVKALNVFVNELVLSTSLQDGDVKVSTVEHLMSAFSALGIDNIVVELDSFEVPIMDGSSSPFVFLVQAAGIEEQDASKNFKFQKIKSGIYLTGGGSNISGIEAKTRRLLNINVKKGSVNRDFIHGEEKILADPEYSASLGLFNLWLQKQQVPTEESVTQKSDIGSKIGAWLKNF